MPVRTPLFFSVLAACQQYVHAQTAPDALSSDTFDSAWTGTHTWSANGDTQNVSIESANRGGACGRIGCEEESVLQFVVEEYW